MISRKFDWLSSTDVKNRETLEIFEEKMITYYNTGEQRDAYKEMISEKSEAASQNPVTLAFLNWLKARKVKTICEVGCGTGRIWQQMESFLPDIHYTGIDVSKDTIKHHRERWPNQSWYMAGAYDLPSLEKTYDIIFSFYVLEHLVFPEDALNAMLSVLNPNGVLVIICPDFGYTGRLPSQQLGFGIERSSKDKYRKGKWMDALVSLFDSKVRLRNALNRIRKTPGSFYINHNPICLHAILDPWPDIDAVYISTKDELMYWALQKGLCIDFPAGNEGIFAHHIFAIFSFKKTILN